MAEQIALPLVCDVSDEAMAFDDGRLYLLVIERGRYTPAWSGHIGAASYNTTEECRTVHVVSRPAGGEIRGYIQIGTSPLYLRTPAYPPEWPELDTEVSRRMGIPVAVWEQAGH